MLTTVIGIITVLSALLVVYHHVGYPVLLKMLGRRSAARSRFSGDRSHQLINYPSITILVPAYNEAAFIAHKIRNLATLDYPADKLKIVIACDGSRDATYDIALETLREPECLHCDIRLLKFDHNRGKIAVLNQVIAQIETDIVALSDVSALISIDALQLAARQFQDPAVGVVNSRYRLLSPGSAGEGIYWEFQSQLKAAEASIGSVIGAHGAFYLIRTQLYQTLPADTINDDFIIPMQIVLRGYRSVYDADIIALELECAGDSQDSQRRSRIAAGNLQQALRLRRLLSPRFGGTAFTFASGKVLRVLVPYLMITAFAGSVYVAPEHALFRLAATGQTVIYLCYALLEFFSLGNSARAVQSFKYLLRGHLNNLRGSLAYAVTSMTRLIRGHSLDKPSW